MQIVAVLKIIGTVVSIVSGLIEAYKSASEYFDNPDDVTLRRYEAQMTEIVRSRQLILNACALIYQAITQLDQTIFRQVIADKRGDADQAQLALDTWRRLQDVGQRNIALNESAGALADLLLFSSNGVYPNTSLVVPLMEVLLVRLMILKEADPTFITSPVARQPIEDSIRMIRSTADWLEKQIVAANQITETKTVSYRVEVEVDPDTGRGTRVRVPIFHVTVRYHNVSGTAAYSNAVSFEAEDSSDADATIAQFHWEATAVRSGGLAEDLRPVQGLRGGADWAERMLRGEEIRKIEGIVGRKLSLVERVEFETLRESTDLRLSFVGITDKYLLEEEFQDRELDAMTVYDGELLTRKLTDNEAQALTALARTFGSKAVLHTLLNHPDCVLNDRAGVMSAAVYQGDRRVEGAEARIAELERQIGRQTMELEAARKS